MSIIPIDREGEGYPDTPPFPKMKQVMNEKKSPLSALSLTILFHRTENPPKENRPKGGFHSTINNYQSTIS